jgi:tetratricopeptide (TPR) repeat protein
MGLSNYAQSLIELARTDEAAGYAERAYQGGTQADNQIVVNQSRLRLARIYRERHDLTQATRVLDDAEASMHQLLPPGHFAFASVAAERALVARERGDFSGALGFINQAIQIDERAGQHKKAGAQFLPILLTHRATIELAAAQLPAADADTRRALMLLSVDARPGDYSVYTGRAQLTLARVLSAEGNASEARSSAKAAAQQLEQAVGPDHPETRAARQLSEGGAPPSNA